MSTTTAVRLAVFMAAVFVGSFAGTVAVLGAAGAVARRVRRPDPTVELDEALGHGWPEVAR